MWEHKAAAVIMDLTRLCSNALRREDMAEARVLCDLIAELERIYPDAANEIARRYPSKIAANS